MKKKDERKKKPPEIPDKILLREIEFLGYCGVSRAERSILQKFAVDVDLFLDLSDAGKSGNISNTVDYSEVAGLILKIGQGRTYVLLEEMAEAMASRALGKFPIEEIRLLVKKCSPPVEGLRGGFAVEISRSRN